MTTRAGFVTRLSAFVIDAFILAIGMRATAWLLTGSARALGRFAPPVNLSKLVIAALPLLVLFYNVCFWTALGQTPGKRVMGVKIVDKEGQPIRLRLAVVRLVGYMLSALPCYLGFLWILGPERRAWHDRLAHTVVVYVAPRRIAPRRLDAAGTFAIRRGLPQPPALALALALLGCLLAASCAHQLGKGATEGATQNLRKQAAAEGDPNTPPLTVASSNVVAGALDQLSDPRQMERLRVLTAKLASQAVASAFESAMQTGTSPAGSPIEDVSAQAMGTVEDQLVSALGASGTGPVARSLSATADELTAAAARGVAGNLLPGCDPRQSPGCVEREISELSRRTGAGLMRGIKQEIRWVALVGIFLAGFVSALFVTLLWQLIGTRRLLRKEQAHPFGSLGPPVTQE